MRPPILTHHIQTPPPRDHFWFVVAVWATTVFTLWAIDQVLREPIPDPDQILETVE